MDVFEYYKDLIALRKAHPAFKMTTTEQIATHLKFIDVNTTNIIAYSIDDNANGDIWKSIIVVYNARVEDYSFDLPEGEWTVAAIDQKITLEGTEKASGQIAVPEISMMVLYQQ